MAPSFAKCRGPLKLADLLIPCQDIADLGEGSLGVLAVEGLPTDLGNLVLHLARLGVRVPLLPEPLGPTLHLQPPAIRRREGGIFRREHAVRHFVDSLGHDFENSNWLAIAFVSTGIPQLDLSDWAFWRCYRKELAIGAQDRRCC
jgi:hypothetical protein